MLLHVKFWLKCSTFLLTGCLTPRWKEPKQELFEASCLKTHVLYIPNFEVKYSTFPLTGFSTPRWKGPKQALFEALELYVRRILCCTRPKFWVKNCQLCYLGAQLPARRDQPRHYLKLESFMLDEWRNKDDKFMMHSLKHDDYPWWLLVKKFFFQSWASQKCYS